MLTIVWDVDDVLNDLTRLWLTEIRAPANVATPAYEALSENPPHVILGQSLAAYLASLDAFRQTETYAAQAPQKDVHAWFREHGGASRHLALTAVPLSAAGLSAAWVLRHYAHWIRSFNLVPSARPGDPPPLPEHDKAAWLSWFGLADVLVDDSQVNVDAARNVGVRAMLFPRPWNADAERPLDDFFTELGSLRSARSRS